MKKKFTETNYRAITRVKSGEKTSDVARSVGGSPHTIYMWRSRYKDMSVSEAKTEVGVTSMVETSTPGAAHDRQHRLVSKAVRSGQEHH